MAHRVLVKVITLLHLKFLVKLHLPDSTIGIISTNTAIADAGRLNFI